MNEYDLRECLKQDAERRAAREQIAELENRLKLAKLAEAVAMAAHNWWVNNPKDEDAEALTQALIPWRRMMALEDEPDPKNPAHWRKSTPEESAQVQELIDKLKESKMSKLNSFFPPPSPKYSGGTHVVVNHNGIRVAETITRVVLTCESSASGLWTWQTEYSTNSSHRVKEDDISYKLKQDYD